MSTRTGTDQYERGQAQVGSVAPGSVLAIVFDTNNSPGANISTTILAADDIIPICWIPEGSVPVAWHIDIADLDAGSQLDLALEYGDGTDLDASVNAQSAITITDADADVNVVGVDQSLSKANSYIRFLVVTGAQTVHAAAARISGMFLVKGR